MRPDVAAFRELDTLVRNLSEQLAGYRRRALASEARARELEQQVSVVEAKLGAAIESARRPVTAASGRPASAESAAGVASPSELRSENERLRERLVEARERTIQVADRVRFLRQQLSTGTER